jgi:hypothetical protein
MARRLRPTRGVFDRIWALSVIGARLTAPGT